MTLSDYLKVFRHRWLVILACTASAAAVVWAVTPPVAQTAQKPSSYTATATLLVGGSEGAAPPMGRIALFLKTGDIPRRAAAQLDYPGDPALLADDIVVTPDFEAAALTVAATDADGERAALVANVFADQTVAFFKQRQPGTGSVSVTILQKATPIPNVTGGSFVVPPSRETRTALAAAVGLLLGLGLALVLDRLDSRLRSREEISAALRLPIIAEVPRLKRAQRRRHTIGTVEQQLSPYADSYRAARTALVHTASLQLMGEEGLRPARHPSNDWPSAAKLVLVTSAQPGEGKTTSVANLAASFAETGQRVLVLDADLRSPDMHTLFDVPQGAGISDYLSHPDDTSLEALIRPTSIPGVRIITAGTRLEHPASLTSRMGGMLTEARGVADVVLIDTAPLLAASDVFDILPLVDTVLLVVRVGRLTEVAGHRVSDLLSRFQVPVSGVLVIGSKTKHGYGYRYGYGYGYGYGGRKRSRPKGAPPRAAATPDEELIGSGPEMRGARHRARHDAPG